MYVLLICILVYIHQWPIFKDEGLRIGGDFLAFPATPSPHSYSCTLSLQKFKQKKDDCPARLSAAAAEQEEISSPPDLSVTRRFDFAEPALSAAECHAPAFPAATGHDRATRELSSTQQHNNISSGPKQI